MDAATALRDARERAGLSVGGVARRAGVPTSTASRIEAGTLDPTTTMLSRLLAAAGCRLQVDERPIEETISIARLATTAVGEDDEPNWVPIRHLVDLIEQEPELVSDAIETPAPRSGSERLDALLAALAELLADRHGIGRPRWCSHVPRLEDRWESAGTPRMRAREAHGAPQPFRNRNIWLSAAPLWREHGPAR